MLAIVQTYPEYTIFYNGPRSGASAPDHFHFQLAARHIMPLETDVNSCPKEILWISESREATIESIHTTFARISYFIQTPGAINGYLRAIIVPRGTNYPE